MCRERTPGNPPRGRYSSQSASCTISGLGRWLEGYLMSIVVGPPQIRGRSQWNMNSLRSPTQCSWVGKSLNGRSLGPAEFTTLLRSIGLPCTTLHTQHVSNPISPIHQHSLRFSYHPSSILLRFALWRWKICRSHAPVGRNATLPPLPRSAQPATGIRVLPVFSHGEDNDNK